MKKIAKVKGLSKLNTVVTAHIRARPPQHGTSHLDMYLLSMEKQRREQEIAHLDERMERIQERLTGIQADISRLGQIAQMEETAGSTDAPDRRRVVDRVRWIPAQAQSGWKTMPLEY